MKRNKRMILLVLCFLVPALLTGGHMVKTARADTEGTAYVAKATPYYKHPVTGEIEDPGNNEGIGQSMTESVLYKKALIEETTDGKLYATVRIFLTDNINNIKIWTQKKQEDSWKKVSTQVMQENLGGKYCSDYRFEIPEITAVMRMSFYVTPMGRDVIFYFNFSNLKKGSADFVTSVKTTKTVTEKAAATKTEAKTSDTTVNSVTGTQEQKSVSRTETKREPKNTASPTGEELVEEADGLVLSDDSLLSGENDVAEEDRESDEAEKTVSASEETKQEGNEAVRVSWVLVLQCILIITVPSLILLFAHALYMKYIDGNRYE